MRDAFIDLGHTQEKKVLTQIFYFQQQTQNESSHPRRAPSLPVSEMLLLPPSSAGHGELDVAAGQGSSTSPDGGARPWTSKETDGAETLGPPLRAFSGLRLVHTRPFFASRCDGDAKWMLGMRLLLETGLDRQNNCPRRKIHLGHRLGLLLETASVPTISGAHL